ncbi:FtsQ-type POTRA domain-containing protein, partial [Mycobacterium sp. NAZ190054]|uniref:FtsQ-type POTRA domain-containing protein n=1 Tax=Mycobacterium sp. NAZ190054 TaxID=1747766 RepID=UPI000B29A144
MLQPRLQTASLYLCTDARRDRGDLAEFADAALAGGVDIIQLRDKGSPGEQRFGPLEAREELAALEILADAARRHGALLAVNDRADIAERVAGIRRVASARVQRQYPSTLRVTIVERVPVVLKDYPDG